MTLQRSAPITNSYSTSVCRLAKFLGSAVVLAVLVVVAYLPAVRAGFIWDDDVHVSDSVPLRSVEGLRQIWVEIGATPQYYPLVHTSFWLEYQLWGLQPSGYHITNIVLHALSVILLWRILRQLNVPGAWFAAAVFAIHPLNVESVAWISERKNVLSGLFYLWSAWAYLAWALPSKKTRNGWWLYGLSLVLFACALLSKTVACTLPFALLAILWWRRGRITRGDLLSVLPMLTAGLAAGLLTVWMEKHVVGAMGDDWGLSLLERVLVAGRVTWFYAWKLVWPQPLMFIYPRWQIDVAQPWQYLYPAGVLTVLVVLWSMRARIGRGPLTAVMIFLITLMPASGFFDVYPMVFSFVMDHFQYLAGISLVALLVSSAANVAAGNRTANIIRAIAGICLLVALLLLTSKRCQVFHNAESLWSDTLAKNPQAWMAHNNLGMVLLKQGDLSKARHCFEKTLELRPQALRAHNNLGGLLVVSGELAEAKKHFEEALRIEPDFVGARLNLCKLLLASGEVHRAMTHYLHALRVDVRVADTNDQLAFLLLHAADPQNANDFFQEARDIKGDWILLNNEMAWILATSPDAKQHDSNQALELARQAAQQSDYKNARQPPVIPFEDNEGLSC